MKLGSLTSQQRENLYSRVGLVIVHATNKWDHDEVSKQGIQNLIEDLQNPHCYREKETVSENTFEFMARHDSFIHHNGIIIDNNRSAGDYILDNLRIHYSSNRDRYDFVLVGGSLGECHYLSYQALLAARGTCRTSIHLPVDTIYKSFEKYVGSGDTEEHSRLACIDDAEFREYENRIMPYKRFGGYLLAHDGKKISMEGAKNLRLMIWSSSEMMINYLVESSKNSEGRI